MNLFPSFAAWQFAVAGLICAAGPILIHLLNRRRYRVVQWAAMEFLLESVQRNRKIIRLRDFLLLLLRTAAVLLFGLALAQPYLSRSDQSFDGTQSLHAILLVDNSLSMGYETLEGTTLDLARARAREFVERLPSGSLVSVIPLCGSVRGYSPDPFETKQDALEALEKLEVVDRSASYQHSVSEARRAIAQTPDVASRVVLIGDQQRSYWNEFERSDGMSDLPAMQIVNVAPSQPENTWIADVRVQDGLADVETPATIVVELGHCGETSRRNIQVTLTVDDSEVASKIVNIASESGTQQLSFEHVFQTNSPEPGSVSFVPIGVSLTRDQLPLDDERHLVVPVIASLPVVFVDQYGSAKEDALAGKLGETRHLRTLLAPGGSSADGRNQLVEVRHITVDQLSRDILSDARLVVVAGVRDPGTSVHLLRDFVSQGGQLVLAAGGEFDAASWSTAAWLDGKGILPSPLSAVPLGATPTESPEVLKPFSIDFESLGAHPYFMLAGVSGADRRDLFAEPFFFKAIKVELSDGSIEMIAEKRRQDLQRPSDQEENAPGKTDWLRWTSPNPGRSQSDLSDDEQARQRQVQQWIAESAPNVLATFSTPDGDPFIVEQTIGKGRVVFVTTGLLSNWNTLPKTNAIVMLDRVLRSLLEATTIDLNFQPRDRLAIPVPTDDRDVDVWLRRPKAGDLRETLDIGFIGPEQIGFTVERPLTRGTYDAVATRRAVNADASEAGAEVWGTSFAVNGPEQESILESIDAEAFSRMAADAPMHWVGLSEEISLAGSQIRGQDAWWWLVGIVLVLLVVEGAILAPGLFRGKSASEAAMATPSSIYLQDTSEP